MVWKESGQLEEMAVKAWGILINHLWPVGCFILCLSQHAHSLGQTSLILLEFPQWGLAGIKWDLFSLTVCPLFHHKTSQELILFHAAPPPSQAHKHPCASRMSFCAQKSNIWGFGVSSPKSVSRLGFSCPEQWAGFTQEWAGLTSNKEKPAASWCQERFISAVVWPWRFLLHLAQKTWSLRHFGDIQQCDTQTINSCICELLSVWQGESARQAPMNTAQLLPQASNHPGCPIFVLAIFSFLYPNS